MISASSLSKTFNIFLILLTLSLFSYTPTFATSSTNYVNAINESRKYLKKMMKKTGTIGMSVAVVDNNKIVYSEGFGYSNKEEEKKVTTNTVFRVGSVTKLFTATAIMQLVENGMIDLDSPITDYLPDFSIKSRFKSEPITVRDLLTHQSGLPSDIYNGWSLGQVKGQETDTIFRIASTILSNEYMANPPRKITSYCNIGFSLLGKIIENVSNDNFDEYIKNNIFSRLEMNHSTFNFSDKKIESFFSKGYFGKEENAPFYIRDRPAGSLTSNVNDLSKFLISLFNNDDKSKKTILKKETLEQMWTPQNNHINLDFDTLGLTYWLSNNTRIPSRIVSHGGDIPPFHAMLGALPDVKLGIIVLVNSEQGSLLPSLAALELMEKFYEAKTEQNLPNKKKRERLTRVKMSEKRLKELSGLYTSNTGPTKAEIKRGKLTFDFFGKKVTVIPHSDSTASLRYMLFGFLPIPSKTLKSISIKLRNIEDHNIAIVKSEELPYRIIANKYEPKASPIEWIDRCGVYEIKNEKEILFKNKKDKEKYKIQNFILTYDSLSMDLCLNNVPINPISPNEALIRGIGRGANETIRCYTKNEEEYLWAWGYALKKIDNPQK